MSFGTTCTGINWLIAGEKGSVTIDGKKVTIGPLKGEEKTLEKPDNLGGVKQEVFVWAESLVLGSRCSSC